MTDIGIVGLDTSHADAFAGVLDNMDGVTVSGVWDDNDVRDDEYIESFCAEYHARRYEDLNDLSAAVDAVMVLTVDWESHVPFATTFLDDGLPTMVDKPVTGSLAEVSALGRAATNARLFGGSAVPFHSSFSDFERGGTDRTLYAAGYNDFFYYRAHLTDTVRLLADADWSRVTPGDEPGTTVDVGFENGTHATLRFDGSPEDGTFSVLDVGEKTNSVSIEGNQDALTEMYIPFMESFRAVIDGERDDTTRLLDSATLLLAVELAIEIEAEVTPDSEHLATVSVDSSDFLSEYDPYY
jgi:hypothetical protein